MKIITSIALACVCFAAEEPDKTDPPKPATESTAGPAAGEIPAWGLPRNPSNKGKFEADGDALSLTVAPMADLNPQINVDAPAVLTEVEGDFTAELTVAPLPTTHKSWVGGGLVVFRDNTKFVRFDHSHRIPEQRTRFEEMLHWMTIESAKSVTHHNLGSFKIDAAKPSMFRIERRGNRLHGAYSNDGKVWQEIYPLNIFGWPQKIRVGAFGINFASVPQTLSFTGFKITKNKK